MFKILIIYQNEQALRDYLHRWCSVVTEEDCILRTRRELLYRSETAEIRCLKYTAPPEQIRGIRAHIIAVEQFLAANWANMYSILSPLRKSPIPLMIF